MNVFVIPNVCSVSQQTNPLLPCGTSIKEILAIEVLESSTGQIIEGILTQLTEKIGTPFQIVADHGSDLIRSIERYQQKNSFVKYTHDVTHRLGILFKKALGDDPKYQSFCQKCSLTRSQIQQTHLHFLTPPKLSL
jgi:hypothetical protein